MNPSSSCVGPGDCLCSCPEPPCLYPAWWDLHTYSLPPALFLLPNLMWVCPFGGCGLEAHLTEKESIRCSFQPSRLACLGWHTRRNRSQVRQSAGSATLTSVIHAHWSLKQRQGCKGICLSQSNVLVLGKLQFRFHLKHMDQAPIGASFFFRQRSSGKMARRIVSERKQEALPRNCPSLKFSEDIDWHKEPKYLSNS